MEGLRIGAPIVQVYHEKSFILPDVSRVLACLYEKDVKFETHTASYRSLLRLQASSHAPVPFYDGPTFLEESREICRYIAEKYENQGYSFLLGKDALERASVEQWLHNEEHAFNPPSRALFCHLAFPLGEEDDDIDVHTRKLEEVLEVYEQRLSDSEFLVGNKFTLADLVHLPNSHYIKASNKFLYLYDSRKNVRRWWDAISDRSSWKEVLRYMKNVEEKNKQEELKKQQQQQEEAPSTDPIRVDSRKQSRTEPRTILVPPADNESSASIVPRTKKPLPGDHLVSTQQGKSRKNVHQYPSQDSELATSHSVPQEPMSMELVQERERTTRRPYTDQSQDVFKEAKVAKSTPSSAKPMYPQQPAPTSGHGEVEDTWDKGVKGRETVPDRQQMLQKWAGTAREQVSDRWKASPPSRQAAAEDVRGATGDTTQSADVLDTSKKSRGAYEEAKGPGSVKEEKTSSIYKKKPLVAQDSQEQAQTIPAGEKTDSSIQKHQQASDAPNTFVEKLNASEPARVKTHSDFSAEQPYRKDTTDDQKVIPPLSTRELTSQVQPPSKPSYDEKPTPMSQQKSDKQRVEPPIQIEAEISGVQHASPSFPRASMDDRATIGDKFAMQSIIDERVGEPTQMQTSSPDAHPASLPTKRETPEGHEIGDLGLASTPGGQISEAKKVGDDPDTVHGDVYYVNLSTQDVGKDAFKEPTVTDSLPSSAQPIQKSAITPSRQTQVEEARDKSMQSRETIPEQHKMVERKTGTPGEQLSERQKEIRPSRQSAAEDAPISDAIQPPDILDTPKKSRATFEEYIGPGSTLPKAQILDAQDSQVTKGESTVPTTDQRKDWKYEKDDETIVTEEKSLSTERSREMFQESASTAPKTHLTDSGGSNALEKTSSVYHKGPLVAQDSQEEAQVIPADEKVDGSASEHHESSGTPYSYNEKLSASAPARGDIHDGHSAEEQHKNYTADDQKVAPSLSNKEPASQVQPASEPLQRAVPDGDLPSKSFTIDQWQRMAASLHGVIMDSADDEAAISLNNDQKSRPMNQEAAPSSQSVNQMAKQSGEQRVEPPVPIVVEASDVRRAAPSLPEAARTDVATISDKFTEQSNIDERVGKPKQMQAPITSAHPASKGTLRRTPDSHEAGELLSTYEGQRLEAAKASQDPATIHEDVYDASLSTNDVAVDKKTATDHAIGDEVVTRSLHDQQTPRPASTQAQPTAEAPQDSDSFQYVRTGDVGKTELAKPTVTDQEATAPAAGPTSVDPQRANIIPAGVAHSEQKSTPPDKGSARVAQPPTPVEPIKEDGNVSAANYTNELQMSFQQQARSSAPTTIGIPASDTQSVIGKIQVVTPDKHGTDDSGKPFDLNQGHVSHASQAILGQEELTSPQGARVFPTSDTQQNFAASDEKSDKASKSFDSAEPREEDTDAATADQTTVPPTDVTRQVTISTPDASDSVSRDQESSPDDSQTRNLGSPLIASQEEASRAGGEGSTPEVHSTIVDEKKTLPSSQAQSSSTGPDSIQIGGDARLSDAGVPATSSIEKQEAEPPAETQAPTSKGLQDSGSIESPRQALTDQTVAPAMNSVAPSDSPEGPNSSRSVQTPYQQAITKGDTVVTAADQAENMQTITYQQAITPVPYTAKPSFPGAQDASRQETIPDEGPMENYSPKPGAQTQPPAATLDVSPYASSKVKSTGQGAKPPTGHQASSPETQLGSSQPGEDAPAVQKIAASDEKSATASKPFDSAEPREEDTDAATADQMTVPPTNVTRQVTSSTPDVGDTLSRDKESSPDDDQIRNLGSPLIASQEEASRAGGEGSTPKVHSAIVDEERTLPSRHDAQTSSTETDSTQIDGDARLSGVGMPATSSMEKQEAEPPTETQEPTSKGLQDSRNIESPRQASTYKTVTPAMNSAAPSDALEGPNSSRSVQTPLSTGPTKGDTVVSAADQAKDMHTIPYQQDITPSSNTGKPPFQGAQDASRQEIIPDDGPVGNYSPKPGAQTQPPAAILDVSPYALSKAKSTGQGAKTPTGHQASSPGTQLGSSQTQGKDTPEEQNIAASDENSANTSKSFDSAEPRGEDIDAATADQTTVPPANVTRQVISSTPDASKTLVRDLESSRDNGQIRNLGSPLIASQEAASRAGHTSDDGSTPEVHSTIVDEKKTLPSSQEKSSSTGPNSTQIGGDARVLATSSIEKQEAEPPAGTQAPASKGLQDSGNIKSPRQALTDQIVTPAKNSAAPSDALEGPNSSRSVQTPLSTGPTKGDTVVTAADEAKDMETITYQQAITPVSDTAKPPFPGAQDASRHGSVPDDEPVGNYSPKQTQPPAEILDVSPYSLSKAKSTGQGAKTPTGHQASSPETQLGSSQTQGEAAPAEQKFAASDEKSAKASKSFDSAEPREDTDAATTDQTIVPPTNVTQVTSSTPDASDTLSRVQESSPHDGQIRNLGNPLIASQEEASRAGGEGSLEVHSNIVDEKKTLPSSQAQSSSTGSDSTQMGGDAGLSDAGVPATSSIEKQEAEPPARTQAPTSKGLQDIGNIESQGQALTDQTVAPKMNSAAASDAPEGTELGPNSSRSVQTPFSTEPAEGETNSTNEESKSQQKVGQFGTQSFKDNNKEADGTVRSNISRSTEELQEPPSRPKGESSEEPENQQLADQAIVKPLEGNEQQAEQTKPHETAIAEDSENTNLKNNRISQVETLDSSGKQASVFQQLGKNTKDALNSTEDAPGDGKAVSKSEHSSRSEESKVQLQSEDKARVPGTDAPSLETGHPSNGGLQANSYQDNSSQSQEEASNKSVEQSSGIRNKDNDSSRLDDSTGSTKTES
ncbi:uncharacterized protein [Zea mays]|uniref:uncharacterized protein isoform X5 n=1 Tax=Zea mays TaxID=4577 RepID=UPI001652E560|nr:uncharacterized protein LOC103633158 isoform X5 [Zea mays]